MESILEQCQQLYVLPQAWQRCLHAEMPEQKNECLQKGTQNFHEAGILFMIFGSPSQEVGDLPVVCLQVGFLVYTGAADFDETLPHLEAACAYFAEVQPEVL